MYRGKLILQPLDDGRFWELEMEFAFKTPYHAEWITIPKGFLTDMASIPALMQWFEQPATGKHRKAAVCHDYLYRNGIGKRKHADDAFLYLMKMSGVSYVKRYALYSAVRAFGGFHWNEV